MKTKLYKTIKPKIKYILPSGNVIKIPLYQKKFLDHVFNGSFLKENEINFNPEPIKYLIKGKLHTYYPDFFIPKFNLMIEISLLKEIKPNTRSKIIEKARACKQHHCSYNFMLIKDNDFLHFDLLFV